MRNLVWNQVEKINKYQNITLKKQKINNKNNDFFSESSWIGINKIKNKNKGEVELTDKKTC